MFEIKPSAPYKYILADQELGKEYEFPVDFRYVRRSKIRVTVYAVYPYKYTDGEKIAPEKHQKYLKSLKDYFKNDLGQLNILYRYQFRKADFYRVIYLPEERIPQALPAHMTHLHTTEAAQEKYDRSLNPDLTFKDRAAILMGAHDAGPMLPRKIGEKWEIGLTYGHGDRKFLIYTDYEKQMLVYVYFSFEQPYEINVHQNWKYGPGKSFRIGPKVLESEKKLIYNRIAKFCQSRGYDVPNIQ